MSGTKSLPCTIFGHVVWAVQGADGTLRRAEIALGQCLLLFTSLDSAHEYINSCDADSGLRAPIFSRTRKEFGRRAREVAHAGVVGALIDPDPCSGEAPFLKFARSSRS